MDIEFIVEGVAQMPILQPQLLISFNYLNWVLSENMNNSIEILQYAKKGKVSFIPGASYMVLKMAIMRSFPLIQLQFAIRQGCF